MRRGPAAFTLIELIVVMVIMALTASIAIPKLSGGILSRERLRGSVRRLAAVVNHARDSSVLSRQPRVLSVDMKDGAWRLIVPPTASTEEREVLQGRLPDGVTFQAVHLLARSQPEGHIANLRFTLEGWVDPAVIYMSGPEGEIHSIVITAPAGRVETYSSRVSPDGLVVASTPP